VLLLLLLLLLHGLQVGQLQAAAAAFANAVGWPADTVFLRCLMKQSAALSAVH
jgi:hypothetical protein